jgi:hypothetical protein
MNPFPIRPFLLAAMGLAALVPGLPAVSARSPTELVPLNPASPNFPGLFSRSVKIGNPLAEPSAAKASHEMLLAVYAYLSPSSPAVGDPAYRDRLLVLLDDRCGRWAAGKELADISCFWEASYAYYLLKSHEPAALSESRKTLYESALEKNRVYILNEGRLLYDQGLLANLWLNGDIRLAKGVYFGALARNDDETAEKARRAIDTVMTRSVLGDGATRYVGFWGEIASYHDEAVRELLWWWLITGSPSAKAAVDATLRYTVVATGPDGFTEQSSNIPYKHMYNNRNARESALWKAYLHNEGYNYYFGAPAETASSTELLNAILYQPSRVTRTPPSDVGAFFDANIQGPRGRFGGSWGWIAHGRDVQNGGPEHHELIAEQGHAGRQGGKSTFVGAFALGPIENKTSLKGALDSALVEFKESAGPETDLMRGNAYRYLAQDEQTRTITRRNFGTLSTSYRISRRISSPATPNWDAGRTPWLGQQLWVLTGKRIIGLMQILSDSDSTVYGLDARLVFTGGRKGIMGSFHELTQPDSSTFAFGDLRAKIHESTFTETITQQRIAISDPKSTDDFSALVRIPATAGDDAPVAFPAGTRRWIVTEITRDGHDLATDVKNLLPNDATWAALQMDEGDRRIQIVQNLTSSEQTYRGDVVAGSSFSTTSLHRSWSESVTHLDVSTGKATLTETIPAYGHLVAVSSKDPEDHRFSQRGSEDVYGKVVPITSPEN